MPECTLSGVFSFSTEDIMFEHRQHQMEKMMKENPEFLRIFNRHQELDKRVTDAEFGTVPMDDLSLVKLKKEKLLAKDQLARMMDKTSN